MKIRCFVINVNRQQDAGMYRKWEVCGKSANTARLQDELTGALIGLARATEVMSSL